MIKYIVIGLGFFLFAGCTITNQFQDHSVPAKLINGTNVSINITGEVNYNGKEICNVETCNSSNGSSYTGFAKGSVIFSDGIDLTEDNSGLYYNDTSNALGVNVIASKYAFDIKSKDSAIQTQLHFSLSGNDVGGCLISAGDNNFFMSSGACIDGGIWEQKSPDGKSVMLGSGGVGLRAFVQKGTNVSSAVTLQEGFRLTYENYFGINQSIPTEVLQVRGNGYIERLFGIGMNPIHMFNILINDILLDGFYMKGAVGQLGAYMNIVDYLDNSKLFVDYRGYMGIGTNNPQNPLFINLPTSLGVLHGIGNTDLYSTSSAISSTTENNSNGIALIVASDTLGHRASVVGVKAGGNLTHPTAPADSSNVFSLLGSVWDGWALRNTAMMLIAIDGNVSSGIAPQSVGLWNRPNGAGSWSQGIILKGDGNVELRGYEHNTIGTPESNFSQFNNKGRLTMNGSARTKKEIKVDANSVGIGASAPTSAQMNIGASGNVKKSVLKFSKVTQNDVFFEFHSNYEMDVSEDAEFHLMWIPDTAYTTGNYRWCLEYLIKSEDAKYGGDSNSTSGTPTTICESVTPSNADDFIETHYSTGIDINFNQILVGHFYRDVANDNADDEGNINFFEIEYYVNSLGEEI